MIELSPIPAYLAVAGVVFHGGMTYRRLGEIAQAQRNAARDASWSAECIVRLAVSSEVEIPERPRP